MRISRENLESTLEAISKLSVLVVGDIILDRYVWGAVERISPEAPVPIVEISGTEDRLGGAANVVRNLSALGAQVSLSGFIGDDTDGKLILGLLEKEGARRDGVIVDRDRPTTVKTRVIAHRQQMIRIDRELRAQPSAALTNALAAVVDGQIDQHDVVIFSDYGKGAVSATMLQRIAAAKSAGRIGLGVRPMMLDPHPSNSEHYRGVGIVKPNRKEAEAASGIRIRSVEDATPAGKRLIELWQAELVVLTLGEDGLVIVFPGTKESIHLPTLAREVFDVSGAGDTVTALFAAAMAAQPDVVVAGELANIGAGIVVSEIGTAAVTLRKLQGELAAMGSVP